MTDQNQRQTDIVQYISDGSIKIDSIREYGSLIKTYPNRPELLVAFSDFLLDHKLSQPAARTYRKSAKHFIRSGKVLQAVAAKLKAYQLSAPQQGEMSAFYQLLQRVSIPTCAMDKFLIRLSEKELEAVLVQCEIIKFKPQECIKNVGDLENHLFMIISGVVRSSPYVRMAKNSNAQREIISTLSENDVFGNIYPLETKQTSPSQLIAVTQVELLALQKSKIDKLGKRYPNVKFELLRLWRSFFRRSQQSTKISKTRARRLPLSVRLSLTILPKDPDKTAKIIQGASVDISLDGLKIVLDPNDSNDLPHTPIPINTNVKVRLSNETVLLEILGKIAWVEEMTVKGDTHIIVGVKFNSMAPKLKGYLVSFPAFFCES